MIRRIMWMATATVLLTGCWGSRYVSADPALETIYTGKSYYDVVADFGQPDATARDGMEGTVAAYNSVNLEGTRAAALYTDHRVRNKATHEEGSPDGGITFSFDTRMRCYAVDSDFEMEREEEAKKPEVKPVDRTTPVWAKPRVPRTLDYPDVQRRSPYAKYVSIERIEVGKETLTVHFLYKERTPNHRPVIDSGICVAKDIYVEDVSTGRRYHMQEVDGVTLYPQYTRFAHNEGGYDVLAYSVTFEGVPAETAYINIVEPGHSGRNFYRVDVRTRNALTEKGER